MSTRGRWVVKNPQNLVNVVYEWPLLRGKNYAIISLVMVFLQKRVRNSITTSAIINTQHCRILSFVYFSNWCCITRIKLISSFSFISLLLVFQQKRVRNSTTSFSIINTQPFWMLNSNLVILFSNWWCITKGSSINYIEKRG